MSEKIQQFNILKRFIYNLRKNPQPPCQESHQQSSPQIVNEKKKEIESPGNKSQIKNESPKDETNESQKKVTGNSDNLYQIQQYRNQNQSYGLVGEIPKKLPYVFWPFVCLFIVNLGLGIAIFATQGDEAAIIVFEVFMVLLNIISGAYYYTKSTEIIVTKPKCYLIFFGTMLAEFLCLFIQLLISWITKVSFSFQLANIIQLAIFLLYFYYQRKKYFEG